ncbi:hypothetical protein BDZ89DRAFT_1063164 [Hymenopellis radicata]|nr:hypothetical protein BDZ89DRAFT_1063164 [Hymenopellis radicata]
MQPTSEATTVSKEAVLKSFSALSADDRGWVIRKQKLEEETTALRARLPDFLQPFASNISVCDPSIGQKIERLDGAYESGFNLSEAWVAMVISPPASPGCKSSPKCLDIHADHWWTCCSKHAAAKLKSGYAYAAAFDNPGEYMYAHTSKGVKEVVADAVKYMGYTAELDKDACMKVLDAFMGTLGARLMSHEVQDEASLRRIIRDGLEKKMGEHDKIVGHRWLRGRT